MCYSNTVVVLSWSLDARLLVMHVIVYVRSNVKVNQINCRVRVATNSIDPPTPTPSPTHTHTHAHQEVLFHTHQEVLFQITHKTMMQRKDIKLNCVHFL